MATKTEKMHFKLMHIQNVVTLEKYLKLFSKNWHKNWLILKVVFSTEIVCKMV